MSGSLSGGGLTQLVINGNPAPAYNGVPVLDDLATYNLLLKYTNVSPDTQLDGATTATDYTEIVVDSTAGFPESGKITIGTGGAGKVFVYTSKTATKFVGASQTMAVNADNSAVALVADLYDLPHRAIMYNPLNNGFYTLSEEDINSIESFYVQKDRANYMGYNFTMDVVIGREELLSVAY